MVTDCKSLYDSLARSESQGLGLQEKRTAIEVAATRQQMEASGISCKWVNSDRQLADSLTKPMAAHAMKQLCSTGRWKIIFDANFTAAKKVKAAKRDEHFKGRAQDRNGGGKKKDPKQDAKSAKIQSILNKVKDEQPETHVFSMV